VVDRIVPAHRRFAPMKSEQLKIKKEDDELKRIVFLIIASLLVIGLVLPSTVAAAPVEIKVLVIGPMNDIQGDHTLWGAQLANTKIGTIHGPSSTDYTFNVIEWDTDEIANPTTAGDKLFTGLNTTGAKIIIGGFRTEAVVTEIPKAMAAQALFFITGAATYSLLQNAAYAYDAGGKYLFRGTPINDVFLLNNAFQMLAMVVQEIKTAGVTNVKVAIFAESLTWADTIVGTASALIPTALNCTLGPVKRVSDTAPPDIVIPALTEIKNANCHAILTVMSGPVGADFSQQRGALDIPAIPVGINVAIQTPGAWDGTLGNVAWEVTMGTWTEGVEQTGKTATFLSDFKTAYGTLPIYNAASYDVLMSLAEAVKACGNDIDAIIAWFENPANAQTITSGKAQYYPKWDGKTVGWWTSAGKYLYALNSDQYNALYSTLGYSVPYGTNFTMPPYTTHDLVYGPGYVTGIAFQWQPVT